MRDNILTAVYTRPIYDIISSGDLTISSAAYAIDDYLCTNPITFSNSFLEQTESYIKIVGFVVRENITAGTLAKAGLNVYILDTCDMTFTANSAFSFADGTDTGIDNIKGVIPVGSYTTVTSGGNDYDAIAYVKLETTPIIVATGSLNRYVKAIPVVTGTPTFDASATVNMDLIIEAC